MVRAKFEGTWLFDPVRIERIRVISSAMVPRCGSNSESSIPHWPRWWNFESDPMISRLACAALSNFKSPSKLWPLRFTSSGLGSNRSIWLGPPSMYIEIIARACGSCGGGFGKRSCMRRSSSGFSSAVLLPLVAASNPSCLRSHEAATAPSPNEDVRSRLRRVRERGSMGKIGKDCWGAKKFPAKFG